MSIVTDAVRATAEVEDHVGRAVALLENLSVNSHGVFNDPSMRRIDLIVARTLIDAAIAIMRETTWPTRGNYDARGEGGFIPGREGERGPELGIIALSVANQVVRFW
jgi:hypothetical protein